jgi:chaperonin GroES
VRIKPRNDLVWLRRLGVETKSKGGIILPGMEKHSQQRCEVLAVGPGKYVEGSATERVPMTVKVGDIVRIEFMKGQDLLEGKHEILLHESELLAVEDP